MEDEDWDDFTSFSNTPVTTEMPLADAPFSQKDTWDPAAQATSNASAGFNGLSPSNHAGVELKIMQFTDFTIADSASVSDAFAVGSLNTSPQIANDIDAMAVRVNTNARATAVDTGNIGLDTNEVGAVVVSGGTHSSSEPGVVLVINESPATAADDSPAQTDSAARLDDPVVDIIGEATQASPGHVDGARLNGGSSAVEQQTSEVTLTTDDATPLSPSSAAKDDQNTSYDRSTAVPAGENAPLSPAALSPVLPPVSEDATGSAPVTSPLKDDPFAFLDEELPAPNPVPGFVWPPEGSPANTAAVMVAIPGVSAMSESYLVVPEATVAPPSLIPVDPTAPSDESVGSPARKTETANDAPSPEEEDPLAFLDSPVGSVASLPPTLPPTAVGTAGVEELQAAAEDANAAPTTEPGSGDTTAEGPAASDGAVQAPSTPHLSIGDATPAVVQPSGNTPGDGLFPDEGTGTGNFAAAQDGASLEGTDPSTSIEGVLDLGQPTTEEVATGASPEPSSGADVAAMREQQPAGGSPGEAVLSHNPPADEDPFAALDTPSEVLAPGTTTNTATDPMAEARGATSADPSPAGPEQERVEQKQQLDGDDEWDDFAAPVDITALPSPSAAPASGDTGSPVVVSQVESTQGPAPADPPATIATSEATESTSRADVLTEDEEASVVSSSSPQGELPPLAAAANAPATTATLDASQVEEGGADLPTGAGADAAPLSAVEELSAVADSGPATTEPAQNGAADAHDDGDEWDDFAAPSEPAVATPGPDTEPPPAEPTGADPDALIAPATATVTSVPTAAPASPSPVSGAMAPAREEEDPFAALDSGSEAPPTSRAVLPAVEGPPESVAEDAAPPAEEQAAPALFETALSVVADVEPAAQEAPQEVPADAHIDGDEWDDFAAPTEPAPTQVEFAEGQIIGASLQSDPFPSEAAYEASPARAEHESADPDEWDDFAAPAEPAPATEAGLTLERRAGAAVEAPLPESPVHDLTAPEPEGDLDSSPASAMVDVVPEVAAAAAEGEEDEFGEFGDFGDFEQPAAPATPPDASETMVAEAAAASEGIELGAGGGEGADDEWAAFEGPTTVVVESPVAEPADAAPSFAVTFDGADTAQIGAASATAMGTEDEDEWDAFEGPAETQASGPAEAFGGFAAPSEFSAPAFEASFDAAPAAAPGSGSFAAFEGAAPSDSSATAPAPAPGFAAFDSAPAVGGDAFGAGGFAAFSAPEQRPSQDRATVPASTPSAEFLSPLTLQRMQQTEVGNESSIKLIRLLPGTVFTEDQAKAYAALSTLSAGIFGCPGAPTEDSHFLSDFQAKGALSQPLSLLHKDTAVQLHPSATQPHRAESSAALRLPGEVERLLLDNAPADALSLEDLAALLDSIEARKAFRAKTTAPAAAAATVRAQSGGQAGKAAAQPSSGDRKRLSLDSSVLQRPTAEAAGGSSPMDFFFGRRASTTTATTAGASVSSGSPHRPATATAAAAPTAASHGASALPPRPAPQRKSSFQTLTATLSAAVSGAGAASGPSAGSSTASSAAPTPPPPALAALTEEAVRARQEEGYYGDSNANLSPAALAFLQKLPDLSYLLS